MSLRVDYFCGLPPNMMKKNVKKKLNICRELIWCKIANFFANFLKFPIAVNVRVVVFLPYKNYPRTKPESAFRGKSKTANKIIFANLRSVSLCILKQITLPWLGRHILAVYIYLQREVDTIVVEANL